MYLADYHTHTKFSPDARASMTEMARAAIAAGFDEICFTDHVEPVVWGGTAPREGYDWDALREDFARAQAEVGEKIQLRLGMELGDPIWDEENMKRLLANAPETDFTIGSIHLLSPAFDGTDLYVFSPRNEAEAYAGLADYVSQVRRLALRGDFCVLGHLTLPIRYMKERDGVPISFDRFEEEIREIFRILIGKHIGIELNTNRANTPLPDEKWLKIYREMGGEIVTLGTDAHQPRHVGLGVREGQELLRACGFKRFCTFERKKPIWHEL
ncbi:MAG: histidinol-phosphatase HisJ family protein [Oscillibacter sp.]|nr:histidinol-phosphatase HisJ family protein [Oscillibacter sp.]